MNSMILTLLALYCVIVIAQCTYTADTKNNYLDFYHAKKKDFVDYASEELEKQCSGIGEKIRIADKNFDKCVDDIDDSLTLCGMAKTFLFNCTEPYLEATKHCLPEIAKDLPSLAIKSLNSVVEYMCTQTGESLLELANPCSWEDRREFDQCTEKVDNIFSKYLESVPSANDICNDVTELRSCVDTWVTSSCKNPITKRAQVGLYDAFIAPCRHSNKN